MVCNSAIKYIANRLHLINELKLKQFKGTPDHSELRLVNQQQRKVWCEGKHGRALHKNLERNVHKLQ